MSDIKLLVGILEKIANICRDNIAEFGNDVNLASQLGLDSSGLNLTLSLILNSLTFPFSLKTSFPSSSYK